MDNKNHYVGNVGELPLQPMLQHSLEGAKKRIVFDANTNWPDYVMRYFEFLPGTVSDQHAHPWPHYVFIHKEKEHSPSKM